jgi:O-antigen/teichoic acid export membrane protein
VIGQSSLVTWFFQGLEKMQFIALLTLLGRIVFCAVFFLKIGTGFPFSFLSWIWYPCSGRDKYFFSLPNAKA